MAMTQLGLRIPEEGIEVILCSDSGGVIDREEKGEDG
jgi:hypothetical protein